MTENERLFLEKMRDTDDIIEFCSKAISVLDYFQAQERGEQVVGHLEMPA